MIAGRRKRTPSRFYTSPIVTEYRDAAEIAPFLDIPYNPRASRRGATRGRTPRDSARYGRAPATSRFSVSCPSRSPFRSVPRVRRYARCGSLVGSLRVCRTNTVAPPPRHSPSAHARSRTSLSRSVF